MRTIKGKLNMIHALIGTAVLLLFLLFGQYIMAALRLTYPWTSVVTEAVIAGIGIVIALISGVSIKTVIPIRKVPAAKLFASILMLFGTMRISASLNLLASYFFDNAGNRNEAITQNIRQMPLAVSVIVIALLPAVCEEIFFRGFILMSARSVGSDVIAILISAVIFSALHFDLYSIIQIALLGILFGYIALKTESLIIPIAFHFFNNGLSTVVSYFMPTNTEASAVMNTNVLMASGYSLISGMTAAIVGYIFFNYKSSKSRYPADTETEANK